MQLRILMMSTKSIMVMLALSTAAGAYYVLASPRVVASPLSHPVGRPVVAPGYKQCDAAGCCDEVPAFCQAAVPAFADGCAYQTIASRCAHSCGKCYRPAEASFVSKSACKDEWVTCSRLAKAQGDSFCELDTHRQNCRSTCGTCGVTCEDSRSHRTICARAKTDLRRCAAVKTAEQCPETCGVCARTPLHELLERQACADPPMCALSEQEVSDAALATYRACEDFEGSCNFTSQRPDHASLCSDPTYRDVLCRATCNSCPDGPAPPWPKPEPVPAPAKMLRRAKACSDVEARTCPRKCGVCKPRGSRSDWDVANAERLVMTPPMLREH